MEKIPLTNKELGLAKDTDLMQSINELVNKINEIVDYLNAFTSQPNCKHNWVQGTSGYWCDKCNKYKV